MGLVDTMKEKRSLHHSPRAGRVQKESEASLVLAPPISKLEKSPSYEAYNETPEEPRAM